MECHFCDAIHLVGPYVLVVFFSLFIYKLIKRHQEHIAQLHGRTLDVFERQAAVYERVHYDLVAIKKDNVKDVSENETTTSRKR